MMMSFASPSMTLVDWLTTHGVIGDFAGACPCCGSGQLTQEKKFWLQEGQPRLAMPDEELWPGSFDSGGKCFSCSHLTLAQLMKHLYYWPVLGVQNSRPRHTEGTQTLFQAHTNGLEHILQGGLHDGDRS